MKRLGITHALIAMLLILAGIVAAKSPQDNPMAPYVPQNMKQYFLVLRVSDDKSLDSVSKEEHAQLVMKHLAFLRTQVEAGKIALVGPVLDHGHINGMAIMRAASLEEATAIEQGDPMVQAGYSKLEVHPVMLEDLSAVRFEYPSPR